MADIKIEDIQFTGNDFFSDSESFMTDLSDDEMGIQAGMMMMDVQSSESINCGTVTANETSSQSIGCRF